MVNKGEMTRELLGAGLKSLMLQKSFDKITIKMITDEAGVIRPTFYNHFKDKYELLEYIFHEEIGKKIQEILQDGMERESMKLLFLLLEREKEFYQKAFLVTGQNGFEEIMAEGFFRAFMDYLEGHETLVDEDISFLNKEMVARYYATALTTVIKLWLCQGEERISAEQMAKACYYLMEHSIADLIQMED